MPPSRSQIFPKALFESYIRLKNRTTYLFIISYKIFSRNAEFLDSICHCSYRLNQSYSLELFGIFIFIKLGL